MNCTKLFWSELYLTVLQWTVLNCTAVYCTYVYCGVLHISELQCTTHKCTAVQLWSNQIMKWATAGGRREVHYSTGGKYIAVHCSTVEYRRELHYWWPDSPLFVQATPHPATHCTLFYLTLHTLHSKLHTPYLTLHTIHSTLHTAHYFPLHTIHTTAFKLYTLRFALYILHSVHCPLSTVHCTLYTVHCTYTVCSPALAHCPCHCPSLLSCPSQATGGPSDP